MSFKEKIFKAFIWDYVSKIARQSVTFVISIILARILGPDDFGVIAIANVFVTFSNIFIDSGISAALVQKNEITDKHLNTSFVFNFVVGILFTFLLYFSAPLIYDFYKYENLKEVVELISIIFILNSIVIVQQARYQKELKIRFISLIQFITSIISGIAGLIFVFNGYGVYSLVYQILIDRFLYVVIFYIKSDWYPKFQFDKKSFLELWNFAKYIFYSQVIYRIINRSAPLFIGKVFDASTLGFYNRATSFKDFIFRFISESLRQIMFPVYSQMQNDTARIIRVTKLNIKIISFLIVFVVAIVFLNTKELIVILLTEKWLQVVDYLSILIFSGITMSINQIFTDVLKGKGLSKLLFKLSNIVNIVRITNLFLIPVYGAIGFLYGILVVGVINFVIRNYIVCRELASKKSEFIIPLIHYLFIGALSISVSMFLSSFFELSLIGSILLKTSIFTLIYIAIIFIFNISNSNEIINLIKDLSKTKKLKSE